jgi:alkanesulfonate monooxygenase SsuD/methylene tetrahydromethanopterin reductase-like flavin-dependent oxidoreductase (luciferase family)
VTLSTKIGLLSLVDHTRDPVTGLDVSIGRRLQDVIAQGVLAEQVGFERFGVGEHHFSQYVLPNPTLILAALATRTSRIRLLTAVTLLACRDPVQLAEDIGILDCLSDGRLELSFARGVSWDTARVFGINHDNVYTVMAKKLDDLLGILRDGKLALGDGHDEVAIVPPPIQRPWPTLWIGGGLHEESCALAVDKGLPLILPSLFRYPEDYLPLVGRYRQGMIDAGRGDRIRVAMPSYCWVAKNSQDARRTWRPRMERYVALAQGLRDGHGRGLDFESLVAGPAICGSPAEVVDRLGAINQSMQLDSHILMMDLGGAPFGELEACLELMGKEVLPHFNHAV